MGGDANADGLVMALSRATRRLATARHRADVVDSFCQNLFDVGRELVAASVLGGHAAFVFYAACWPPARKPSGPATWTYSRSSAQQGAPLHFGVTGKPIARQDQKLLMAIGTVGIVGLAVVAVRRMRKTRMGSTRTGDVHCRPALEQSLAPPYETVPERQRAEHSMPVSCDMALIGPVGAPLFLVSRLVLTMNAIVTIGASIDTVSELELGPLGIVKGRPLTRFALDPVKRRFVSCAESVSLRVLVDYRSWVSCELDIDISDGLVGEVYGLGTDDHGRVEIICV